MIENLEVHHLRTLEALYQSSSITITAERLNISQQAVSQQLQRLRKITGDRLFIASGHGVTPTPYARQIEPAVRQLLSLLNQIPLPGALVPERIERTLTISSTDHAQRVIIAPLLRQLATLAPGVTVVVVNIENADLTRKLQVGEIDLAFTTREYVPAGLVDVPLFYEHYCCVTSNPALFSDGKLTLEQLVQYSFVVVSPGVPSFDGSAGTWFERRGWRRKVGVSVPSFFMAQECLLTTDMVGFVPSRLLPQPGLTEVELEEYPPGFEVVAAYHSSAAGDPFLTWLLQLLKSNLMD